MIDKNSKIFVAGSNGMVGSSCYNKLKKEGFINIIAPDSSSLDLRDQKKVKDFIFIEKPDVVINAAAKVGGILANDTYPYRFIMENLQIQCNLIDSSLVSGVEKFIFLGSSCIYPKFSPQPIKEKYLLSNSLEETNQWYAIAKISGVKTIQALNSEYKKNYISLMPTNLYGPNDNFDLNSSHVIPAMIRKFSDAKLNNKESVTLWGTGKPKREFLHVDDLSDAILFAIKNKLKFSLYNVGTGNDISILELSELIKKITNFEGRIIWDLNKPDGTPRKLLDVSLLKNEGWVFKQNLLDGLNKTYIWFMNNQKKYRKVKFD